MEFLRAFYATSCAIKYSRGIPWSQNQKKPPYSELGVWAARIEFMIREGELCIIVDGEEEPLRFPLGYIKEVKILP